MEKFIDTDLLSQIDDVLVSADMSKTEFGKRALNDRNLVTDLEGGRELRSPTRKRVLDTIKTIQSNKAPLSEAS